MRRVVPAQGASPGGRRAPHAHPSVNSSSRLDEFRSDSTWAQAVAFSHPRAAGASALPRCPAPLQPRSPRQEPRCQGRSCRRRSGAARHRARWGRCRRPAGSRSRGARPGGRGLTQRGDPGAQRSLPPRGPGGIFLQALAGVAALPQACDFPRGLQLLTVRRARGAGSAPDPGLRRRPSPGLRDRRGHPALVVPGPKQDGRAAPSHHGAHVFQPHKWGARASSRPEATQALGRRPAAHTPAILNPGDLLSVIPLFLRAVCVRYRKCGAAAVSRKQLHPTKDARRCPRGRAHTKALTARAGHARPLACCPT